jgi:ABC-type Fe3+ transport system permease subunit
VDVPEDLVIGDRTWRDVIDDTIFRAFAVGLLAAAIGAVMAWLLGWVP